MDKQLLDKLMRMAKLELSEAEQAMMLTDLNKIYGWIEKLQEVDTEGIDPLTALALEQPTLREDIAQPPLDHTKALSSSKYVDSNYFRVPKVKDARNITS
ncbi:MAG: glutamyl-tRNA amidotransferase [Candidatus Amoebophilus sp. 36-38]|nr:MAG: glutamyl-tRNA amidotransferase [Candidatus Amoebophilus sp. 36-38]